MIEKERDESCDADCAEEGVAAPIVSGGDAPPVLQSSEEAFYEIALLVEFLVVLDGFLAVRAPRYAGLDVAFSQCIAEFVAVIALVANETVCLRQVVQNEVCAGVIADLAFCEQQDQRLAIFVANRMEFGIQASFCASDKAGNIPFFCRLEAVRWAFR